MENEHLTSETAPSLERSCADLRYTQAPHPAMVQWGFRLLELLPVGDMADTLASVRNMERAKRARRRELNAKHNR